MSGAVVSNLRVSRVNALLPPFCAVEELPGDMDTYMQVIDTREKVLEVLRGKDDRLIVVLQYDGDASTLEALQEKLRAVVTGTSEQLVLLLQPRMKCEPDNATLRQARKLLLNLNQWGVPVAFEFADTVTPQFFSDLVSWASVSAQSEMLRELVSGLSFPTGMSAAASEAADVLDALDKSGSGHRFLGVSSEGLCGIVESTGNADTHAVLAATLPPGLKGADAQRKAATELVDSACAAVAGRPGTALFLDISGEASSSKGGPLASALAACVGGTDGARRLQGARLRFADASKEWDLVANQIEVLAAAVKKRRATAEGGSRSSKAAHAEDEPPDNLRIKAVRPLLPPACLVEELPREEVHEALVSRARNSLQSCLNEGIKEGSGRLIVIAGPPLTDALEPCKEYAARLAALAAEVQDDVLLLLRLNLVGGFLNDPEQDGSYHFNRGLRQARELLLQLNAMGVAVAFEFADTVTPQFFADLISWSSVSARGAMLRELVSGLSMPVGLQVPRVRRGGASTTTTHEDMPAALEALRLAGEPQRFFGVTAHGIAGIVHSTGNSDCTLLLSGGAGDAASRVAAVKAAADGADDARLLVECGGDAVSPPEQLKMVDALCGLIGTSSAAVRGVVLSSSLLHGSRPAGAQHTVPGLSSGAPCIDWMETQAAVRSLAAAVRKAKEGAGGAKRQKR